MKIEFKNVSFKYDELDVLDDVSFTINDGESVAIIGPNGSGKSTIAKLMTGLLEANKGSIYIDNILLNEKSVDDIRKKIGIIFQNPDNQFVGITVIDDIAFGLENRQIERSEMIKIIDKYSKMVHVDNLLYKNPEEISGGQKQRVAIAGVLALEPSLLIFDEATSMLDPIGVSEINKTLKMLKFEAQKTIITITHNIEEILYFDKVILLNEGKIKAVLTPTELLSDKNLLVDNNLNQIDSIKLLNMLSDKHSKIKEKLWELTFRM